MLTQRTSILGYSKLSVHVYLYDFQFFECPRIELQTKLSHIKKLYQNLVMYVVYALFLVAFGTYTYIYETLLEMTHFDEVV